MKLNCKFQREEGQPHPPGEKIIKRGIAMQRCQPKKIEICENINFFLTLKTELKIKSSVNSSPKIYQIFQTFLPNSQNKLENSYFKHFPLYLGDLVTCMGP